MTIEHDRRPVGDWAACDDCRASGPEVDLSLISANLGEGAFLRILCSICWHRRQYRARLERERTRRRAQLELPF
jgi:hypothetical protein